MNRLTCCSAGLLASALLLAPSVRAAEPATVAEASAALDLEKFPLPGDAQRSSHQRPASLSYSTLDSATDAFAYVEKRLADAGWKTLPGGYVQDQFASGAFENGGFVVHVSTMPHGDGKSTMVQVSHQGNVSPSDVPVPDDAEAMYAFPAVAMFKSPSSVEETAAACRELMTAEGWSPYGQTSGSESYRKNAVVADLSVQSAPAQGGATVINVTTHLISLELPAPPFGDGFRYTDGTTALGFDCDETPERVSHFYREALAPLGWKATTDKPVKIKWKLFTIFRNDAQEMITLSTHDFEGRTRAFLDHQNADEVAVDERSAAAEAGRIATYRIEERPTVEIALPEGLEGVAAEKWDVKVDTNEHDPFEVAEGVARSLESGGWQTASKPKGEPAVRVWRLVAGEREVRVVAAKAPKHAPWVSIAGVGVEIDAR